MSRADELPFVVDDRDHARDQLAPPLAGVRGARAPRPRHRTSARRRAGSRSRRASRRSTRTTAVPVSNRSCAGPDLERRQAVEDLGLAVQRAEVRPEPLVGAADEEVGVERLDVDRAVGRVGDRVDVRQRADLVGARDDLGDRVDRPDRVAGIADRDELGVRVELRFEVLEVERHVVQVDVDPADGHAAIGGHRLPGADVGLVVQRRDHDLVARVAGSRRCCRPMCSVSVDML